MESVCPICKRTYTEAACPSCAVTGGSVSGVDMQSSGDPASATAFLVDLVSNRKIPITTPRCKVGRDDLNDIVISGDQSISRFHFVITKENGQYNVQDGKSRHGTFLNGNQISGPEPIHDGDVLKVGVSLFWFVIEALVPQAGSDKASPVEAIESAEPVVEIVADPTPAPTPFPSHVSLEETTALKAADWTNSLDISVSEPAPMADATSNGKEAVEPSASDSKSEPQAADKEAEKAADKPADKADEKAVEEVASNKDTPEGVYSLKELVKEEPAKEPTEAKSEESSAEAPKAEEPAAEPAAEPETMSPAMEDTTLQVAEQEPIPVEASEKNEPEAKDEKDSNAEQNKSEPEPSKSEAPTAVDEPASAESSELPSATDTINNVGNMDYQFSLSEDQINQVAGRIADSFAAASYDAPAAQTEEKVPQSLVEAFDPTPQETLDKLAETVAESRMEEPPEPAKQASLSQYLNNSAATESKPVEKKHSTETNFGELTTNGAKVMSILKESASNAAVPDWCRRYFSAELTHLDKELTELNEEVRQLQIKIKDVEGRTSLTKGLRNVLLTTQGDELVDACGKIFAMMGWRVRVSDEDKLELKMEAEDKSVCIARVVWTDKEPDRSHLGQLSISQTRYWCEVGVEPKGILIIARAGDHSSLPMAGEYAHELSDYASKKNVCLMSTLQLLASYKEVFLHDNSPDSVKAKIQDSSGWLTGFHLEPGSGTEPHEKDSSSGKASLSSLLSA